MEALDRQFVELQKYAERKCRKIIKPDMEFSLEVKLWHKRVQAYKALIRLKEGKARNVPNIMRHARCNGISNPEELTVQQLSAGVTYAKAKKKLLKSTAPAKRHDQLREWLLEAESKHQQERAKGIKEKMEREGNKKMWYVINRSQKDPGGKAIHTVQRVIDGELQESIQQEDTEQFIFEETEVRFGLANDAPISRTTLIQQLGYLADTEVAQQLVAA